MEPRPDLIVGDGSSVFALLDEAYVAYLRDGAHGGIDLPADQTTYAVRWFDPKERTLLDQGISKGGAVYRYPDPPFSDDPAIVLQKTRESGQ